ERHLVGVRDPEVVRVEERAEREAGRRRVDRSGRGAAREVGAELRVRGRAQEQDGSEDKARKETRQRAKRRVAGAGMIEPRPRIVNNERRAPMFSYARLRASAEPVVAVVHGAVPAARDELLHDLRIGEGRGVAEGVVLVGGDLAEDAAHDLAGARLREAADGELDELRRRDRADDAADVLAEL